MSRPTNKVINFSGGESSGLMLYRILAENGSLPQNYRVLFCNTGLENNATLDFVKQIEESWDVRITWLEYYYDRRAQRDKGQYRHGFKVVRHDSASRNGEPFEELIDSKKYLPNPVQRICTQELKVNTMERYLRRAEKMEKNSWISLIGIRKDEERRVRKALMEHCNVDYPLYHAGITKADVLQFWQKHPFRLRLPENGRLGNCELCFLKSRQKLMANIREDERRVEWWIRMEDKRFGNKDTKFRKGLTYRELLAKSANELQIPVFGDDELDCFCGE